MPCCLLAVAMMVPRLVLIWMLFSGYLGRAVESLIWPLLGFFFMPYTTCAYMIGMNENDGFRGWSLVVLIVAVIFDLGGHGGGARATRTHRVHIERRL